MRIVKEGIPQIEQNMAEAVQVIGQKKFSQSLSINTISIDFHEIDDSYFYFTQFSSRTEFTKLFKILEVR